MVVTTMNVLSLKYFCLGWSYSLEESTCLVCEKPLTQSHGEEEKDRDLLGTEYIFKSQIKIGHDCTCL